MTAYESRQDDPPPALGSPLDLSRVRNFAGLVLSRLGPRAFEVVHGTFLTLVVGARTGSAFMVALALTAHRLLIWLVYPMAGRVSDSTRSHLGRRAPFIGGGLLVMGVATWSYTVLSGYWTLVLAILIARVANTTRQLAGIVVVPETFGRTKWIRALVAIAVAGTIVSLSLRGTVIATWDEADPATWAIAFRMAAAFMVGAGIAVLILVRDTEPARKAARRPPRAEPWRTQIREILEVPNAGILAASVLLTVAASGATGRLAPLYFREELGAGGAEQSLAILVGGALGLVLSVPVGVWLSFRLTRRQLAITAPLVVAIGSAMHLTLTSIWQSVVIGVVTGAVGLAALLALLALYLQCLPRSGGMGERLGLVMGPIAFVGVLSTYLSAVAVDFAGSYRAMWLFPTMFGLVHAVVMTRLWVPAAAARLDPWDILDRLSKRRARHRGGRARSASLFHGEIDPEDVDASVFFEVARHALGNPYAPPGLVDPDEPEIATRARRVLAIASVPNAREAAAVAEMLDDDVVLYDPDAHVGRSAVLDHLRGPAWSVRHGQVWRLTAVTPRTVSFQAVSPAVDGEVEADVSVGRDGRVASIQCTTRPTAAHEADVHVAGLGFPVPTAIDLPRPPRRQRWTRMLMTGRVVVRHLGPVLMQRPGGRADQREVAGRLRRCIERLGGGYVKLGQLVASTPDFFGAQVADELRTTLVDQTPVPVKQVEAVITDEFGRPWHEVFSSVDPQPLAAASFAVVHRAVTTDGREVAVKIIRPGIEEMVAADLMVMEPVLARLLRSMPDGQARPLLEMLRGLRTQVSEELDLRNECRAMARYREVLAGTDLGDVVIPEPVEDLSGRRVLTMELLDGVRVADRAGIEDLGIDPGPLIEQALKAWFLTAVSYGTFHGDFHAGNLLLLRDGRAALVDWGIVARLDPATHEFLRNLLSAVLGDASGWGGIATFLGESFGCDLARAGIAPNDAVDLLRPRIEAMFLLPAGHARCPHRSKRSRTAAVDGVAPPSTARRFNRGLFLLAKQLMYIEHHRGLHMPNSALLEDREFFEVLVGQRPAAAGLVDPED